MLDRLMGTSGGAQERRVVGGSQRIVDSLVRALRADVRFSEPVRAISQDETGCHVRTDVQTYDAACG